MERERDWAALGRKLKLARSGLGLTQTQVAERLGVVLSVVQGIERGREYKKVQGNHRAMARIVGWAEESVEAVLAGGDPIPAPEGPAPETESPAPAQEEALADGISERARLSLKAGRAVDSDVIDLPDDDSEIVLVFKRGSQTLTPEQMRDDMRRWARLQRVAREIFSDRSE